MFFDSCRGYLLNSLTKLFRKSAGMSAIIYVPSHKREESRVYRPVHVLRNLEPQEFKQPHLEEKALHWRMPFCIARSKHATERITPTIHFACKKERSGG